MSVSRLTVLGGLAVVALHSACAAGDPPAETEVAAKAVSAPSWDELAAATYSGLDEAGGPVTLVHGRWEGRPFVGGGAARPWVELLDGPRLEADLDGDDAPEAVAFLAVSGGGSGTWTYVAVVGHTGNRLTQLGTVSIGDRVQLRDGRLDGRLVVVDLVQAGETDAMCCPGDLATRAWRLGAAGLEEVRSEVTGRLRPEAMLGPEWVLTAWTLEEPAAAEPEITLRYEDGEIAGSSGCNRYFASVSAAEGPGEIAVGPVGGTMMVCPPEVMDVEVRFLRRLEGVTFLSFVAGRLALTGHRGESSPPTTMFFERR